MSEDEIQLEPPATRPAGWFPDQKAPDTQRWWSGDSWTDHTRPTPQSVPPESGAEDALPNTMSEAVGTGSRSSSEGIVRGIALTLGRVPTWWWNQRIIIKVLSALAVAGLLVTVFAVLLPMALRPTHHFQGMLSLSGDVSDVEGNWDSCSGTGGYDDFTAGAPATIRDGEGNIVGQLDVKNFNTQTLDAMLAADARAQFAGWGDDTAEAKSLIKSAADLGVSCLLYVEGDVNDSDFYTFTFSHRGDLSYSRAQLAEDDWWVSLSLGG